MSTGTELMTRSGCGFPKAFPGISNGCTHLRWTEQGGKL
jgi:hypothetical protein